MVPSRFRAALVAATLLATGPVAAATYSIVDLGVLPGGSSSVGLGINDAGQVVGWSGSSSGNRAFLWDPGTGLMQNLGTLPGEPSAKPMASTTPGRWSAGATAPAAPGPSSGTPGQAACRT